ncbi:DNA repair protein RadC [Aureisphaera galaxeae]|uniref:RadC family protein n=1 Tax=Aureisphaera galaxeae TaxID=1538023 RepID=UPI0023504569|nr:DNA repair protein RadC [Aureisphaera galaxeae]MDC8005601.1 DNA repair protein RadC [Aureisphaera galaxeae]
MGENSTSFSIKTWNEDDRPREKLLVKGPSALSDAELIAILIGSGNRNESAVGLSKRILAQAGNSLKELGKKSIPDLLGFHGIGEAKAITILAAMELGRRRQAENVLERRRITSSQAAFEFLRPMLSDLPHEEFWAVYLNNSNKVLQTHQLSKGGITGTVVDIRLTMKTALQLGAIGIILAHNHPSGTLRPSEADKQLTQKFVFAGNSLDIKILDHLIITEKTYFSFADEQLL